jgi:hypothetical protein
MPRRLSAVTRALPLVATLILGACAHRQVAMVDAPPAVAMVDAPPAPAMPAEPSPINANLSDAATVWHLRAALNVAALGCRAPGAQAMLAAQYNGLLAARRAELAAAQDGLSAEFRAGGGQWQDRYDQAMTRLYNFFATAQAHDRFCAAAVDVMAQVPAMAPGALPAFARQQLRVLDAAFAPSAAQPALQPAPAAPGFQPLARPVIALAAGPSPTRPTSHPRLDLDLTALPGD